jgi:hypothetical protein
MDNFVDEVEEELKRDRQLELWRKYGKFAVAAAFVVVIGVASVIGWRQIQTNRQIEAGLLYSDALDLAARGKTADALSAFKALSDKGTEGYADLARFQEAALLARQGNEAAAAKVYDAIAKDTGTDPLFRDLALIFYALAVVDRADAAELEARLAPLGEKSSPWRSTAREVLAMLAQRRGDTAKAREIYKSLAEDNDAPPGARSRAAEFLSILGD